MNLAALSLWTNVGIFAISAGIVWFAGWKISRCADVIREQLNLSEAAVGLLLLATVTSLPELATAVSGAIQGSAELVVNNLLGAIALQLVILALADVAIGREALSSVIASPTVLLQGVLGIALLALVAAGTVLESTDVFGVGIWSWILVCAYIASIRVLTSTRSTQAWMPAGERADSSTHPSGEKQRPARNGDGQPRLSRTLWITGALAAAILVGGYLLATSGDIIAQRSGLGSSFFGAVFLAMATALPELSTVLSAARLRRYAMAVSDVFGTNLINVAIIFVIDAVYAGEPVLGVVGRFSTFAALLGILVTVVFLAGLIERRDRAFLRMGVDSIVVLIIYISGLAVLHALR